MRKEFEEGPALEEIVSTGEFPPNLSEYLFQMMEDEDLLVQYGLLDGEGEGQNTPYGGGAEVMVTESSEVRSEGQQDSAVTPDTDRKRKAEQLEWMECPVCLETPRSGPIFSCRKGHVICRECQPQVTQCPTCRDKHTDCRSLIAEKLLSRLLKDTPVNCKYRGSGCVFEDLVVALGEHETSCMFRAVRCPASHRGACSWVGPLNKLIQHVIQQKCAQVVKSKPPQSFVSTIGDFAQDQTVFSKNTPTHWKPVMLISQDALKFFCYAIFYRDAQGHWFSYVRSFAPAAVTSNLRVEIRIRKSGNAEAEDGFLYNGQVSSSEAAEADILESGNYLLLRDDQVKKFRSDKTIMEYSIALRQVEASPPPVV